MIRDRFRVKELQQRGVWLGALIALFYSIYTFPIVGLVYLMRKKLSDKIIIAGHIICIAICLIWIFVGDVRLIDFIIQYPSNYFVINDPHKLLYAFAYSLYFLFFGHRMTQRFDDWVVEEEDLKHEKELPWGQIDYDDRSHMLIYGRTRYGKGVLINHIMRDVLYRSPDEQLVVISAKPASTDEHSQLAYLRQLADETGRELIVVSMDDRIADRYQYIPFKYLSSTAMTNLLNTLIEVDSRFYGKNFTNWTMAIYDVLKAGGRPVTIANILNLYQWESSDPNKNSYTKYVEELHEKYKKNIEKGIEDQEKMKDIDDETYEMFLDEEIHDYANVAKNDHANLKLVDRECATVFHKTPNRKTINIQDAFNQNKIIYFDLNGMENPLPCMTIGGTCIAQELLHCIYEFSDPSVHKTVIMDEASFYLNDHLMKAFWNVSASAGWQFIMASQGPSDVIGVSKTLNEQFITNSGQFVTFQLPGEEDAKVFNSIISTMSTSENTHRAHGADYDEVGSIKAVQQVIVPYTVIQNLEPLVCIYLQKSKTRKGRSAPVKVRLTYEDL